MSVMETIALVTIVILVIILNSIPLIIMVNMMLRPTLWTAFNIIGFCYLWFSIILGSQKMFQLFNIILQFQSLQSLQSLKTSSHSFFSSRLESVWKQEHQLHQLRLECSKYVYWAGTFVCKEGILTSLIFTRSVFVKYANRIWSTSKNQELILLYKNSSMNE